MIRFSCTSFFAIFAVATAALPANAIGASWEHYPEVYPYDDDTVSLSPASQLAVVTDIAPLTSSINVFVNDSEISASDFEIHSNGLLLSADALDAESHVVIVAEDDVVLYDHTFSVEAADSCALIEAEYARLVPVDYGVTSCPYLFARVDVPNSPRNFYIVTLDDNVSQRSFVFRGTQADQVIAGGETSGGNSVDCNYNDSNTLTDRINLATITQMSTCSGDDSLDVFAGEFVFHPSSTSSISSAYGPFGSGICSCTLTQTRLPSSFAGLLLFFFVFARSRRR